MLNHKIICGKSEVELKQFDDNTFDSCVTDPQYGWSFMSKDWDKALPQQEIYDECLRVLKPGAFMFWMSGARLDGLTENGIRIRNAGFKNGFTPIFWTYATGFPKASNISKMVDKRLGAKVKIGTAFKTAGEYGNRNLKDPTPQGEARDAMRHKAQSQQAKLLDGSYAGFQPKPAVEVIIVAMKPLSEKTYVEQALKNAKGITRLDDCRIPYKHDDNPSDKSNTKRLSYVDEWKGSKNFTRPKIQQEQPYIASPQGRFPANLLVEDDVLNDGIARKSGKASIGQGGKRDSLFIPNSTVYSCYADEGSFSRYFSLDSWFSEKLKTLPESMQRTFPFLIVPKASKSERNKGCEELPFGNPPGSKRCKPAPGRKRALGDSRQNHHPTVKPLKLMSYLIMLGSREGDLILDPFVGSGTTAVACKMLNRNFIGIEINPEHVEIADARLRAISSPEQPLSF